MIVSMKKLMGYKILTIDGELGRLSELYFEENSWLIRYLVINLGSWLQNRQVLLTPKVVAHLDEETKTLNVSLTKQEVRHSPDVDTQKTIPREQEEALHAYYNWHPYWENGLPGAAAIGTYPAVPPVPLPAEGEEAAEAALSNKSGAARLQSTAETAGYYVKASDGEIGHVADFIVDTTSWIIRYLVIDTRNWLPGKKVLVSPGWVKGMHWPESEVHIAMTRDSIKNSPAYDPDLLISRDYEIKLHEYYNHPPYWQSERE